MKKLITFIMAMMTISSLTAQELKQFTLEDLNFGGKNYRKMVPENRMYEWKGEMPVRLEKRQKQERQKPFAEKEEDHQLYVTDAEGVKHQLTTDGSREIVYGEAVHRNEFGIEDGIFWSPDKSKMAFYRMDQSMVTDYPQVNIFGRIAECEPDKYPMAGETSHVVTVGIYDVASNKTIYLNTGDPTDRYFTNISWSPDAKTVYMFELNRDQNDCRLVSYDAQTGERQRELYKETHENMSSHYTLLFSFLGMQPNL